MAPNPAAAPGKTGLPKDFERDLRGLIAAERTNALQAGRVSVIGLDKVKERLGKNWSRLAERASRIARNTVERYLLPGDIFTVVQETNYVIVFAQLDSECARMKCTLMADEIMKALLGEDGANLITVDLSLAELDARDEAGAGAWLTRLLGGAAKPADPDAEADKAKQVPGAAIARRDPLDGVRYIFRPMWDTTHDVLSLFNCIAALPSSDETGYSEVDLSIADAEDVARLDDAVQGCVLTELARIAREGGKLLLGLPVHFETLAAAARRRRYLDVLARALTLQQAKQLVIEILDVPDGVPQSRMMEFTTPMKPLCRGLVARARTEAADLAALRGSGIVAAGCKLPAGSVPEMMLMQQMNRFNRAAEKAGMPTYARGLRTLSLAAAAVGAGFRYIDGEGVAKLVEHPGRVVGFTLLDVYRPILQS
jgi:hypothetical protein